jgi:nucleoside-diphosphate-sugar epimerase
MPRTLITGGAGFIGLHLGRALLERGHEITLLDNFARGVADPELEQVRAQPRVRFEECDLAGPGTLAGEYDHIVHLAAIVGVDIVRSRPYDVLALNHAMLERTIAFARRQKRFARLVFASTSEVYAGTLRYFGIPVPTPESTPLTLHDLAEPRTSYMLSKIHGEALCRHSGVPWSVVRLHNAYGPRMGLSHVVPQLLRKAGELPPGAKLAPPLLLLRHGRHRADRAHPRDTRLRGGNAERRLRGTGGADGRSGPAGAPHRGPNGGN